MGFPFTEKQSVATNKILTRLEQLKFKRRKVIEIFSKKKIATSWGPSLQVPLIVDNTGNGQIYQGFEPLNFQPKINIRAAKYDWYNRHTAFSISGDDWRETMGEQGKVDLVTSKGKIMFDEMMDTLDTDFFATTTGASRDPLGFRASGGTGATSVGGLTTTEVATWVAERDTTTGAPTLARVGLMLRNIEQNGADPNNLAMFTTAAVLNKFDTLLGTNVLRVPDKGSITYGFAQISILGVGIIADSHVPGTGAASNDSHLAVVDYDTYKMYAHKDNNFNRTDPTPYNFTQDAILGSLNHTGQFACLSRWRQGLFTAIDPA